MRFAKVLLLMFVVSGCDPAVTKSREQPAEPIATAWTPPRGAQTSGDCWTRVARLGDAEMESTTEEFLKRNGRLFWDVKVDPFSGQLLSASRYYRGARGRVDHEKVAKRFLRRNADLLGLSPRDFSGLKWELRSGPHSTTKVVAIPRVREKGAPQVMRSLSLGWNDELVRVRVTPDGTVVMVSRPRLWGLRDPQCGTVKVSEAQAKRALLEHCAGLPALTPLNEALSDCPIDESEIESVALNLYNREHLDDRGNIEAIERWRAYRFRTHCTDWFVDATTGDFSSGDLCRMRWGMVQRQIP